MVKNLSLREKTAIETYYLQRNGPRDGINSEGEPLAVFDLFAETPRRGAKNPLERWMTDLPEVIQEQISAERKGLGVSLIG